MTRTPKILVAQHGGKTHIASWIVSHFPSHRIYLEPFCGSCAVLFRKPPSFAEIVNDLDRRLVNVFRQCREHPQELAALLFATPYSKADWRNKVGDRDCDDSLEDARLMIAQSQQSYGGAGSSATWSIDTATGNHKPKPKVWGDWFLRVLPAVARLKNVQITCEDAVTCIKRVWHNRDALIYVDPPYIGHEREYRYAVDYDSLVTTLQAATCHVVVSEYEAAIPRFPGWRVIRREVTGRCATGRHGKSKTKTEVLLINQRRPKPLSL